MPNGGSDCCGTCGFNERNKGETGYSHSKDRGRDYCLIRDLPVENPFWTYCVNHPHNNPALSRVPVGPVYMHEDKTDKRVPCCLPPDSAQVRAGLLELLGAMGPGPAKSFSEVYFNEQVIRHLGAIREQRAVPELRGMLAFLKQPAPSGEERWNNLGPENLAAWALSALGRILGPAAAADVAPFARWGVGAAGESQWRRLRWGALAALKEMGWAARELLAAMADDPDEELAAEARERASRLAGGD